MRKIKLWDLIDRIDTKTALKTYFESSIKLLSDREDNECKIFEGILRNALEEFSRFCPAYKESYIQLDRNGYFDFEENNNLGGYINNPKAYKDYDIILTPTSIVKINLSNMSYRMPYGQKRYEYNYPVLNTRMGGGLKVYISYNTIYPLVVKYGEDNRFTEDSYIYMADIGYNNRLVEYITLKVLEYIRNANEQVPIEDLGVELLNDLDSQIEKLEENVEFFKKTNSSSLRGWGT